MKVIGNLFFHYWISGRIKDFHGRLELVLVAISRKNQNPLETSFLLRLENGRQTIDPFVLFLV